MRIVGNSIERLSGDIKESRKAYKKAWRTSCSSIEIPRSPTLHKALSMDPNIRLGFLVAPSGGGNLGGLEREAAPAAACHAKCLDWRVAARVVTYGRVVWAIDSSAPYSPRMDGIFPTLLQVGQEVLIHYLAEIFRACLRLATFQPHGARLR
jgi:hypothetical protein